MKIRNNIVLIGVFLGVVFSSNAKVDNQRNILSCSSELQTDLKTLYLKYAKMLMFGSQDSQTSDLSTLQLKDNLHRVSSYLQDCETKKNTYKGWEYIED